MEIAPPGQDFDIGTFYNFAEYFGDTAYCNLVMNLMEKAGPKSELKTHNMELAKIRQWKEQHAKDEDVAAELEGDIPEQVMFTLPYERGDVIAYQLPTGRDLQGIQDRLELFKFIDRDGTGKITTDHLKQNLHHIVSIPHISHEHHNEQLHTIAVQAQMAVFCLELEGEKLDYDIRPKEFRIFLMYLQGYLDLWEIFSDLEKQSPNEMTVEEFRLAVPQLEEFGMDPYMLADVDEIFGQIDEDGSGFIEFQEFADFCVHEGLMDMGNDLKKDEQGNYIVRATVNV